MSDELEKNKQKNYLHFYVYDDRVKYIKGKGGKNYYQILLKSDEKRQPVPKGTWLTALVGEYRKCKKQFENNGRTKFWLYEDEMIRVQKATKNPETNKWEYKTYGKFDAQSFIEMTKKPIINESPELEKELIVATDEKQKDKEEEMEM